jgi:hypothetical protein
MVEWYSSLVTQEMFWYELKTSSFCIKGISGKYKKKQAILTSHIVGGNILKDEILH